jgi:ribosomal protein S18 acetylase RimI-like enzyme
VYTDNAPALALYHKMGFVERGLIPGFFKHHNRYYDQLTLSLEVKC